jgi:hypothetical protein
MPNLLDQTAKAIRRRLAQLEPLVAEQQQLKRALGALEGLLGAERGKPAEPPKRKARAAREAKRTPAGGARRSAARRARPGSRAEQFVALVNEQPGITASDAAKRLNTSPDTLYNVTGRLQREGRLRKQGRGFYPAEQPPAPTPPGGREPPSASAR